MDNGICRPSVRVIGVVAAGAARPAVFQRPRRGDFPLGEHTRAILVPECSLASAKLNDLLDYRGGFLVNDKASVLAFLSSHRRVGGNGLAAHVFASENCLDFPARVSHHPFVS